jgi:peptidoglycan-associated lipoprotein
MLHRTLAAPFLFGLVAALAGCAGDDKPIATPVSVTDRNAESPPRSDNRTAVLQGGLNEAGVGDRVFFASDSSLLSPDATRVLARQAVWLKAAPARVLTIEGHADERGTREYNLGLGERRANAVRDYLIAEGIPSDRLRTLSYGKERPQVAGHDEASWAQNRRGVSVPQ